MGQPTNSSIGPDLSSNLSALAATALEPQQTDHLFVQYEPIFAEICARWLTYKSSTSNRIAAFARILPFAPHLAEYAEQLFTQPSFGGFLDIPPEELENAISPPIPDHQLCEHLLAVLRLLVLDNAGFAHFLQPARLQVLLQHPSRAVRYLTIRILCLYLHSADASTKEVVEKYVGGAPIEGVWEGLRIDYHFLSLWEEQRVQNMVTVLARTRKEMAHSSHHVSDDHISDQCYDVHGVLLPRLHGGPPLASTESPVPTPTTRTNLNAIARAMLKSNALLLTGLPGAGKTLAVRHLATQLNKLDSMVTLHLNEQSDAKLLIGMYTTGADPGSFTWQPGVLTTAVREGRWVFVEDLDRAPNEILSTLLPLIERGELLIPSRGETIVAARGFKIFATMRTSKNLKGEEIPAKTVVGTRFWDSVQVRSLPEEELESIVSVRYPKLKGHLSAIMAIFSKISSEKSLISKTDQFSRSRTVTSRDLLKWCRRMSSLLTDETRVTAEQKDGMFLEAYDSFAGSFQEKESRLNIMSCVAEELHVDPQRRDYLLFNREVRHVSSTSTLQVGRAVLPRRIGPKLRDHNKRPFSTNGHTLRLLEKLGRAVDCKEPLLLVGETGTGKTTCIQYLAEQLGRKLVAFNLSQQSESSDLIGGFKPVNVRTLVIPMKDEFDELFESTFSRKKNQKFLDVLGKRAAKGEWNRVCALWREALKMVDAHSASQDAKRGEQPVKKRKLEHATANFPGTRWEKFAADLAVLEARLAKKSETFAFAFQEGNIIKAVRNGDWILLDEINLASPDTLEALADLFESDSEPSVLLTETGSTKRVVAHPDFRVFAAMNPATDVGKKDLPLGIRSRFTELYVDSPDADVKSLLNIVETYLGSSSPDSKRVADDVTKLYLQIQDLSRKSMLVDGADQKPHFSLRTLTRTLMYASDSAGLCSLRRALYEGFHMSFCTFLSNASENLLAPVIKDILFSQHINSRSELKRPLKTPSDGRSYVQEGHHWLRKGILPVESQDHYILTPFVQRNLNNLIRASSTRRYPVLIQGPTSAGKTSMIEYLAKRSGNRFVRINNHEHTDLQEYLGTYVSTDGILKFQEGILVKALREGYWVVLDELNLAPTDVLEALNRLLDDNRELLIPETQEVVRPHENFMLFATQNPAGLYGGRKVLSRAFRNRFLELHFDDIPVDELTEILQKRTLIPESWAKRIVSVYRELSLLRQEERIFEQKSFATLRDLFRWASRKAESVQDLANNGFMLLGERVRKEEERISVKEIIETVMSRNGPRIRITESSLYDLTTFEEGKSAMQMGQDEIAPVWTHSMRRLYSLVVHAIRNNEPILLVGETGCGKTTVCQLLAKAFGKELHILNAHQNTETGDLIGSQRPVRNRAALEDMLAGLLKSALGKQSITESQSLQTMMAQFEVLEGQQPNQIVPETGKEIRALNARLSALFEWSDGSLVHAMKTGQFFLLDEISLADDSVLERLNSVLEPQRTLLLAEKGPTDSLIVAEQNFQFMATMNPGGDYGKRELSPALRNRFTEIWVPPLSNTEDISHIVQAKLTPQAAQYATPMVSFAQWFNRRYNTSVTSTISIRDMLSWATFVNGSSLPVESSIIHGAAMVYVDTLGANPSAMLALSSRTVTEEREACLNQLGSLIGQPIAESYFDSSNIDDRDQTVRFGPFRISKVSRSSQSSTFGFTAPTTRINAMRIARALQLPKPILIEGNPGVGKTTLVIALANKIGMPLTRINISEQTDLIDLFGSDVPVEGEEAGKFAWQDAPFLRAMKNGEWVLLDEMNLASQSILEGLNACLDHRGEIYVSELDQKFQRHPNFRLFAAQNPHHQGGGRKGLPSSFVNRFTVVYAGVFAPTDLALICRQTFPEVEDGVAERLIRFVSELDTDVALDRRFGIQGSPWEFNLRDTLRWMHLVTSQDGLLTEGVARDFLDTVFTLRFRTSADRESVLALFSKTHNEKIADRSFYHNLSSHSYQVGLACLSRNSTHMLKTSLAFTKPLRITRLPVLESIMISIQHSWPVILVGQSGSGKSYLIDHISCMCGSQVVTFPMSADIDATDLVGGYEQVDHSRQVNRLLDQVTGVTQEILVRHLLEESLSPLDVSYLLQLLKIVSQRPINTGTLQSIEKIGSHCSISTVNSLLEEIKAIMAASATSEGPRFQWVDGVLVEAIERGHWLVLDNANFCSSSLLDRLNSLLEPNGYLIINEHSTDNGEARVVKPHLNFRIFLTMDPKYGELSRAMRNRAVELYINLDEELHHTSTDTDTPCFSHESSIYRYRYAVESLKASGFQDSRGDFDVALDHLSIQDAGRLTSFRKQVEAGLPQGRSHGPVRLEIQQPGHVATGVSNQSTIPHIWTMVDEEAHLFISQTAQRLQEHYFETVPANHPLRWSLEAQAVNPANNELVLRRSLKHTKRSEFLCNMQDIFKDAALMHHAFQTSSPKIRYGPSKRVSKNIRSLLAATTKAILAFAKDLVRRGDIDTAAQQLYSSIHAIWWTLVDICNGDVLDIAKVNLLLLMLQNCISTEEKRTECTRRLEESIQSQLFSFDQSDKLVSGLSMESIWKIFKPSTATNQEKLEQTVQLELVARELDQVSWRSNASLHDLCKTRLSLSQAMGVVETHDANPEGLISDIHELIISYQSDDVESGQPTSRFEEFFYFLSQSLRIHHSGAGSTDSSSELAAILAFIPTKPARPSTSLPAKLQRLVDYADITQSSRSVIAFSKIVYPSLLSALGDIESTVLGVIERLKDEMDVIGNAVASKTHVIARNPLEPLDAYMSDISQGLLDAHPNIADLSNPNHDSHSQDLGAVLRKVNTYLQGKFSTTIARDEAAADCWVSLGLVGLFLYVPNVPLDPALRPTIERQFYFQRRAEFHEVVKTLSKFESKFTGQTSTLRIRNAQLKLEELGTEPPAPQVLRPQHSEMDQLQGEFNNLLTVLHKFKTEKLHESGTSFETVARNLAQVSERLTSGFHYYADLTAPIAVFLSCLKLGMSLVQTFHTPNTAFESQLSYISNHTPLVNLGASIVPTGFEALSDPSAIALRWHTLRTCHLHQIVERPIYESKVVSTLIDDIFTSFYVKWKEVLQADQDKMAAESSLYSYRDKDAIDLDDTDLELFPDYDLEDGGSPEKPSTSHKEDPRAMASELAKLHAEIFVGTMEPQESIQTVMSSAVGWISAAWGESAKLLSSAAPTHELLPLVSMKLDEQLRVINHGKLQSASYNFYFDPNTSEAKRLLHLLQRITTRFRIIQQSWPEHATLREVLYHSREALSFRYIEPLAKMMTKAEKIHSIVYEWQKLASREFSAAGLYEELTSLIVSWRQLELSSWARLFDNEMERCDEDARGWWFVAYEITVIATRSLDPSKESVEAFKKSLLKTLEGYMCSTTVGQYSRRLGLLRQLLKHLTCDSPADSASYRVAVALENFVAYYSRFETSIADMIQNLRKPLEKDINNTVRLATWKDTNIDALRQSAKQSHRKLTKVVRKFREVLKRPALPVLNGEMARISSEAQHMLPIRESSLPTSTAIDHVCSGEISDWTNRPARFRNLAITLKLIKSKTTGLSDATAVCEHLDDFLQNVATSTAQLRKETPSALTKENTEQVKHLKARKRKLLVDSLKELRLMGLRSNIGGDILSQQDSMSAVLADLSQLPSSFRNLAAQSSLLLHKALQQMPKARELGKEHSGDITPAEVARSIAYLENLLHLSRSQHNSISNKAGLFCQFTDIIERLSNLWAPDNYEVRVYVAQTTTPSLPELHRRLRWLSTVLDYTGTLVDVQARLGKIDLSAVREGIQNLGQRMTAIVQKCENRPKLPSWIATTSDDTISADIRNLFDDARNQMAGWSEEYPATNILFHQALPYTSLDHAHTNSVHETDESAIDLDYAKTEIFSFVDVLLGSIQDIENALASLPANVDEAGWFLRHNNAFTHLLNALRMPEAMKKVTELLDLTRSPSKGESSVSNSAMIVSAMLASVLPIIKQYGNCCSEVISHYSLLHTTTTKMLYQLQSSFVQVGTQGFCMPPEKSNEKNSHDDKLEAGTGLGEGEGAEDISKDIEDDEDLNDLAQEPNERNDKEDIEEETDAVDMGDQEMEGEMGDVDEKAEEGEEWSEKDDEDIEDDVGDVDDLGPSTVDEKMWDEGGNEDDKEKAGEDAKGTENKDEQVAAGEDEAKKEGDEEIEEEEAETGNEEAEKAGQEEVEETDPHLQESEKLDLPDDLNMDDEKSDAPSDNELGDLDDMGDAGPPEDAEAELDPVEDGDEQDPTNIDDVDNKDMDGEPEEEIAADEIAEEANEEAQQDQAEPDNEENNLNDMKDIDNEHAAQDDSADVGVGEEAMDTEQQTKKQSTGASKQQDGAQGEDEEPEKQNAAEQGTEKRSDATDGASRGKDAEESAESQAFKKIGDAIERWYKQQREILNSSSDRQEEKGPEKDVDMADADFEHLPDEQAEADTQALGTASEDQAKGLDEDLAPPSNDAQENDKKDEYAMDVDEAEAESPSNPMDQAEKKDVAPDEKESDGRPNAFMGALNKKQDDTDEDVQMDEYVSEEEESDVDDVEAKLSLTHLNNQSAPRSESEARTFWARHENSTRTLAQSLTEQLRLILEPTSATKLRGDFRTGKRLNLKRIIPYIASGYKRDKIWLRRSLPSKRAYQIMIGLDDSQSMAESGTVDLAFETVALVSRALTMLEAGELCVVGFGSEVKVAHPFDRPFTSDAGVDIFRQFGFQQTRTDVKKLVQQSIGLFQDARLRASSAGADLWQLQIIISDGICDSHADIQRLVRQAQEERIMIVFVIVDAGKDNQEKPGEQKKQSILDLQSVDITEEGKVVRWRYMDHFPFRWYLVVREVSELPGVLSMALRQWFKEVADSS